MTIRAYTPADLPVIQAWAEAWETAIIPQLLSPNGFLVEDEQGPLAAVWVYLVFDCPMVLVENLVTRPGTSLKKGLAAWDILWRTIQSFLANLKDCNGTPLSYKVVRTFTRPSLVRFLKGWKAAKHPTVQVIYAIP